jgi:phage shock protein A
MAKKPVNEAVENVRSLARMFSSVIDLAESLGEFSSVEQAVADAKIRLVQAQREVEAVRVLGERLEHGAHRRVEEVETAAAARQARADTTLEQTQAHTAEVLMAAEHEAQALVAEATAKRTQALSECQEMEARRNLLRAEVQALEGRLSAAKNKMAEMLGGVI